MERLIFRSRPSLCASALIPRQKAFLLWVDSLPRRTSPSASSLTSRKLVVNQRDQVPSLFYTSWFHLISPFRSAWRSNFYSNTPVFPQSRQSKFLKTDFHFAIAFLKCLLASKPSPAMRIYLNTCQGVLRHSGGVAFEREKGRPSVCTGSAPRGHTVNQCWTQGAPLSRGMNHLLLDPSLWV